MTGLDPPRHGVRHNALHRLGAGPATLAEQLAARGYATAAFVGALVLDRRFGLDRGFARYDDRVERHSAPTLGYAERPADRVTDAALAWLAGAPDRFFLWVHYYDPHASYEPPPGFRAAFPDDPYAGEIAFVDHQLGRLLEGVRGRWGSEGLLVAVTSDHGESLGEHGEPTHAYGLYDATQHVPLLIAGPGYRGGRVVETPVRLIDLAPSLLAAAGAAPLPGTDGRDLLGLVDGTDGEARPAYLETRATSLDFGWSPLYGMRARGFKYIRAPRPELYDLARDPHELHDLAADRPALVAELDAMLSERLAAERAPEPVMLGAADRARLESLGYVVAPAAGSAAGGLDPKDGIGLLAVLGRAQVLAAAGQAEQALALLREPAEPPLSVTALRAAIAYNAGEFALAASDARRVLAAAPARSDAQVVLGQALEQLGDLEGARDAFTAATAADPRWAPAWGHLARVAERLGDGSAAARARERARALRAP